MQTENIIEAREPVTYARSGPAIIVMMLAAFALLTTEFIIVGLLPSLSRDLGISIPTAGLLVTFFAVAVMLFGPFLTAMLAHVERKKLFICILIIFAVANALSALSTNFWILAVSRVLAALALPVFWGTSSETAAQMAGPGKAGKAVAKIYMGVTAALVLGIPLGTLAADSVGWRGSFWIIGVLCLVVALLMAALMPKFYPTHDRAEGEKQTVILKDCHFIGHVLLSFLSFTSMFTAYTYLADILERIADIPTAHVGWWLMGFGVVGMIGNHYAGRLVERGAMSATILLLVMLSAGMLLAVPLATHHIWLVIPLALWGIAYTALFPVCQIRVMQAGTKAQALAGTMNISAGNGGIALGALCGGLGIRYLGLASLGWLAVLIAVAAIAVALILGRKK